jgi:short-subunit dehydrogenase
MRFLNDQETVFITGVSRGLGEALIGSFLECGYQVIGLVRSQVDAERLQLKFGNNYVPIIASVEEEACKKSIEHKLEQLNKPISVLINNVGGAGYGASLMEVDAADVLRVINLNCLSALRVTQATWKWLKASPAGIVINVSSRLGSISDTAKNKVPVKVSFSYQISKAALNMLTAALNREVDAIGLKIIALNPGPISTRLNPDSSAPSAETVAWKIIDLLKNADHLSSGTFLNLEGKEMDW